MGNRMKETFKNKKIIFLGDSNISHGHGICYIHAFIREQEEKCYVFNRGLGGNRAAMVKYLYDEEIAMLKPDVVFFTYGVNDMACWLYDAKKEFTPKIMAERKQRDEEHLSSMKETALKLKADGIIPVICSQFGLDEFIPLRDDVETIGDNQEKEDYIGPSFYTPQTMKNMNEKIAYYRDELKAFAIKNDILFLDFFEIFQTKNNQQGGAGLFRADGCHLTTDKGHMLMAKVFLEYLGYENVPEVFPEKDEEILKLFEYELFERGIQYIKHARLSPWLGYTTKEKFDAGLKEMIDLGKYPKDIANYLKYNDQLADIEKTLEQKIRDYIDRV